MLAVEMAKFLAANGFGIYSETAVGSIFIASLPPDPDDVICINSTGGPYAPSNTPYDNPTIQIIVRGGQNRTPRSRKRRRSMTCYTDSRGRLLTVAHTLSTATTSRAARRTSARIRTAETNIH